MMNLKNQIQPWERKKIILESESAFMYNIEKPCGSKSLTVDRKTIIFWSQNADGLLISWNIPDVFERNIFKAGDARRCFSFYNTFDN